MGEARTRGTFEERRAQAIAREEMEQREAQARFRQEWQALSPEEKSRRVHLAGMIAFAAGMEVPHA